MIVAFEKLLRSNFRFGRMSPSRTQLLCGSYFCALLSLE